MFVNYVFYKYQELITIYSCLPSPASNDQIIELPRSLVTLDHSKVFRTVVVHALPWIFIGARVQLEPLTVEDWELMEAHAEWLEGGGILQQISVVYPKQVLSIRFDAFRDDIARVKVVQVESTLHSDGGDFDCAFDVWPSNEGTGSKCSEQERSPAGPWCVLLVQDTEVQIAPKTRKSQDRLTPPLRLIPSTADLFPIMRVLANELDQYQGLQESETCSSMTVPPGCILVHASVCVHFGTTVGKEVQWASVLPEESREQKSEHFASLVRVIPTSRLSPSDVGTLQIT
jgi:Peroxisome biogenesis factor 1, N-terminal